MAAGTSQTWWEWQIRNGEIDVPSMEIIIRSVTEWQEMRLRFSGRDMEMIEKGSGCLGEFKLLPVIPRLARSSTIVLRQARSNYILFAHYRWTYRVIISQSENVLLTQTLHGHFYVPEYLKELIVPYAHSCSCTPFS